MRINVAVSNVALIRRLRNGDRRLAYAVVNALNATAKRVQVAERENVMGEFTVRQKTFIGRMAAKIEKTNFANVRRGQAWVEIAVGHAERLLLSKFEEGGERLPFVGSNIALPVIGGPARRTRRAKVPAAWTFEALAFRTTTTRSGRTVITSPNQSAYIIPGVGVFERTAKGTRLVYAFIPRMTLDDRLKFVETARKTAHLHFREEMERETINAIQRAAR